MSKLNLPTVQFRAEGQTHFQNINIFIFIILQKDKNFLDFPRIIIDNVYYYRESKNISNTFFMKSCTPINQ